MRDLPRVRSKTAPIVLGRVASTDPNGISVKTFDNSSVETLLISEPHHLITRRGRKGSVYYHVWSGGGPLYVHKTSVLYEQNPLAWRVTRFGRTDDYILGAPVPLISPTAIANSPPDFSQTYLPDLIGHHTTGWARTRPGKPEGNYGQFLVELRDLPRIPFKKAFFKRGSILAGVAAFKDIPRRLYSELGNFRNLGSEYLNYEFGWRPFVSDVRQMFTIWSDVDKALAKLIRENGKGIRRRATLEEDTSTTELVSNRSYAPTNLLCALPDTITGFSQTRSVRTVKTRVWYSARYRYFIPEEHLQSSLWTKAAKAALFGVLPTPELLWEVVPWSWLIDWFTNVGDIASNLSWTPAENLIADYSFVMKHVEEKVVTTNYTFFPPRTTPAYNYKGVDHTFTRVEKREVKLRAGDLNPFGLGVTLPSLSGRQLGILAALGISRSRVL